MNGEMIYKELYLRRLILSSPSNKGSLLSMQSKHCGFVSVQCTTTASVLAQYSCLTPLVLPPFPPLLLFNVLSEQVSSSSMCPAADICIENRHMPNNTGSNMDNTGMMRTIQQQFVKPENKEMKWLCIYRFQKTFKMRRISFALSQGFLIVAVTFGYVSGENETMISQIYKHCSGEMNNSQYVNFMMLLLIYHQ